MTATVDDSTLLVEVVYVVVVVALLVLAWRYVYRSRKARATFDSKFHGPRSPMGWRAPAVAIGPTNWKDPDRWWNSEKNIYEWPRWLRYPWGLLVGYGAWWAISELDVKPVARCLIGGCLVVVALGLMRELILGLIVATLVGIALWAIGAAVAALPVSIAIIVGALIIASATTNK